MWVIDSDGLGPHNNRVQLASSALVTGTVALAADPGVRQTREFDETSPGERVT